MITPMPEEIDSLFNLLKTDEFQQKLTEQAENAIFSDQSGAENTARTIGDFVDDYLENGRHQPLDSWLVGRFSQYSDIWENEQEKIDTARTIIQAVEDVVRNQVEIEKHLQKGKSLANFLNKRIDEVAKANDVKAEWIGEILEQDLKQANADYVTFYSEGQLPPELIAPDYDPNIAGLPNKTPRLPLDIARTITKNAELNANLNLAWAGAKSVGSRLWNAVTGKENLNRAEQLTEIIRSAVDSAENKGVQVAVSGGMVVSAKKGWVKGVFDGVEQIENAITRTRETLSRVADLVLNVADGWNDVRILDKVERGVLKTVDVAAEKAKFVTAKIATAIEHKAETICRNVGSKAGRTVGTFLGGLLNPAAAAIGGQVGAYVGDVAGKYVSDKVVKPVTKVAKKVADKAIDFVADTAKSVVSKGKELVSDAIDYISESKLNPFNWF